MIAATMNSTIAYQSAQGRAKNRNITGINGTATSRAMVRILGRVHLMSVQYPFCGAGGSAAMRAICGVAKSRTDTHRALQSVAPLSSLVSKYLGVRGRAPVLPVPSAVLLEETVDRFRQRRRDTGHGLEIVETCAGNRFGRAEMAEQRAFAAGANAGDFVQWSRADRL